MLDKLAIEKYFIAQKQESVLLIVLGIAAILMAFIFLGYLKKQYYHGLAAVLLLAGLLQIIIGYLVYNSSDEYRKRNVYAYDMNRGQLRDKEMPRVEKLVKLLAIIKYVVLVLLVGGILSALYFRGNGNLFWKFFCISILIEATVCLGFNFWTEKSTQHYLKELNSFFEGK